MRVIWTVLYIISQVGTAGLPEEMELSPWQLLYFVP